MEYYRLLSGNTDRNIKISLTTIESNQRPVSQRPERLFGPAKPILVNLYLKTVRWFAP